jgi:hypothetical protein
LAAFERELANEKAISLGVAGARVSATIEALAAARGDTDREPLLQAAADAVQAYFIQREACGLRDHRWAIEEYRIPRQVISRLGARPKAAD